MNDLRSTMTKKELAERVDQLEEDIRKAYELLEQSNKEKQSWKQCSHTLADNLEKTKAEIDLDGGISASRLVSIEYSLKYFEKLKS